MFILLLRSFQSFFVTIPKPILIPDPQNLDRFWPIPQQLLPKSPIFIVLSVFRSIPITEPQNWDRFWPKPIPNPQSLNLGSVSTETKTINTILSSFCTETIALPTLTIFSSFFFFSFPSINYIMKAFWAHLCGSTLRRERKIISWQILFQQKPKLFTIAILYNK